LSICELLLVVFDDATAEMIGRLYTLCDQGSLAEYHLSQTCSLAITSRILHTLRPLHAKHVEMAESLERSQLFTPTQVARRGEVSKGHSDYTCFQQCV
jgi:hypothetical protein